MSERMSDERMAEYLQIEPNWRERELVDALKAERQRTEDLENENEHVVGLNCYEYERAEAAEAKVQELEAEIEEIHATGGTSYIRLNAAIARAEAAEAKVKELENALREIVFSAKPNRLSTKNKLVKEGICISGSLQHYEVMPHLIHIGKGLLQEQTK